MKQFRSFKRCQNVEVLKIGPPSPVKLLFSKTKIETANNQSIHTTAQEMGTHLREDRELEFKFALPSEGFEDPL